MAKKKSELTKSELYSRDLRLVAKKIIKIQEGFLVDLDETEDVTKFLNESLKDLIEASEKLSNIAEKFKYKEELKDEESEK